MKPKTKNQKLKTTCDVACKIDEMQPLRILVVATKTPWPAVDGGRLVLLNTIEALAAAGHHIELVAPFSGSEDDRREATAAMNEICTAHLIAAQPRSAFAGALIGLRRGIPVTVARHALPRVTHAVAELLSSNDFDVVHAEQLHALPQIEAARRREIPVVHRAHNVESLLWDFTTHHQGPAMRPLVAFEARRMSAWEVRALEEADCTVALTAADHRALSELVPGAAVHTVRAPFAAELPAGDRPVDGEPAVVTLTSASWAPSRAAVDHLANEIWPTLRRRLPRAVLHVFGGGHHLNGLEGVVSHPPPEDSRSAFPDGAVALIPERHPTGVPMKALEAWARGLPLLVDRHTADILEAQDGVELVVAGDAPGYAAAMARLVEEDGLRQRIVAGGRRALVERHDPGMVAEQLEKIYRWAMSRNQAQSTESS